MDANPTIYPGAPQVCDGVNNDCTRSRMALPPGHQRERRRRRHLHRVPGRLRRRQRGRLSRRVPGLRRGQQRLQLPRLAGPGRHQRERRRRRHLHRVPGRLRRRQRGRLSRRVPGLRRGQQRLQLAPAGPPWPAPTRATTTATPSPSAWPTATTPIPPPTPARWRPTTAGTTSVRPTPGTGSPTRSPAPWPSAIPPIPARSPGRPRRPRRPMRWSARPAPGFPPICGDQITQIPSWSDAEAPPQGGVFYLPGPVDRAVHRKLGAGLLRRRAGRPVRGGIKLRRRSGQRLRRSDRLRRPRLLPGPGLRAGHLHLHRHARRRHRAGGAQRLLLFDHGGAHRLHPLLHLRPRRYRLQVVRGAGRFLPRQLPGPGHVGRRRLFRILEPLVASGGGLLGRPRHHRLPESLLVDCVEAHAWCAESGLADRYSAILPEQTEECEAADFSLGCGPGDWVLTIQVGPDRLRTCGF